MFPFDFFSLKGKVDSLRDQTKSMRTSKTSNHFSTDRNNASNRDIFIPFRVSFWWIFESKQNDAFHWLLELIPSELFVSWFSCLFTLFLIFWKQLRYGITRKSKVFCDQLTVLFLQVFLGCRQYQYKGRISPQIQKRTILKCLQIPAFLWTRWFYILNTIFFLHRFVLKGSGVCFIPQREVLEWIRSVEKVFGSKMECFLQSMSDKLGVTYRLNVPQHHLWL